MPDLIETLRFMLRDPVYWDEEVWFRDGIGNRDSRRYPHPPATPKEVEAAEASLGLPLPPLLKRIYTEVANGGIGPDLLGLFGVPSATGPHGDIISGFEDDAYGDERLFELAPGYSAYVVKRIEDEAYGIPGDVIWTPGLFLISHGGCQYCYYLYARNPDFPVLMNEEPIYRPAEALTFADDLAMLSFFGEVVAPSFDAWVSAYIEEFQQRHGRDYADPTVLASLYPEPHYLRTRKDETGSSVHEHVPLSRW